MSTSRRDFIRASAGGALALGLGAVPAAAQTRLPPAQLRALEAAVRGRVLSPGKRGYDRARVVFNRRFDAIRPPAVVQVRDVADVQAVVRWAGEHGVALVPRSGGHGYNGDSTTRAGVVVDLGALDRIALSGTTAVVEPAARNIDVYATLAPRGVTVPSGSCPTVAAGGITLGGGMGLAGRALGLTIDRVRSFDVVTADGQARRVDADSDPDLFWALRGGGGNFAIVTAIRLRTHRQGSAAYFSVTVPTGSREELLAAWEELAPDAPAALTAICTLTSSGASAFGQYLGSAAGLRRLVAPLGRVPGARVSSGSAGYLALQRRWAGCADGGIAGCGDVSRMTFDAASIYVTRRLSAQDRRAFVAAVDTGATLICDAYGGAINEVAADATAFVHRDARFSVQILSYAPIGTARARVRRARGLIARYGNGEAYQNYSDLDQPGPLRAWYGANLPRLRTIKTAVDPQNRFRITQGIRPAAA